MSSGVTADFVQKSYANGHGFPATRVESEGLVLDSDAPVTVALAIGAGVAAGFGDGSVRLFWPGGKPVALAHNGAVLCLAAEVSSGAVLTGEMTVGFPCVPRGKNRRDRKFCSKWVDCGGGS